MLTFRACVGAWSRRYLGGCFRNHGFNGRCDRRFVGHIRQFVPQAVPRQKKAIERSVMPGLESILVIPLEVCRLMLMLFACVWDSGLFVLLAAGRNPVRGSTSKHGPTTVGTICEIGMTARRAAGRII